MATMCRFCHVRKYDTAFDKSRRFNLLCRYCTDRGRSISQIAKWANCLSDNVCTAALEELRCQAAVKRVLERRDINNAINRTLKC